MYSHKHTRSRYDDSLITKAKLVTVRADICSPMRKFCCGSNKYFLLRSKREHEFVRPHFLKSRSVMKGCFESDVNRTARHSGTKVGRVHTGNVTEFTQMKKNFGRMAITTTTSSFYVPQPTGLAERISRDVVRNMCNCWPLMFKIEIVVRDGLTSDQPAKLQGDSCTGRKNDDGSIVPKCA